MGATMRPGLPANIRGTGGASVEEIIALRDEGLVEWAEIQLPRLLRPADGELRGVVRDAAARLALPVSLHSETATFAATKDAGVRSVLAQTLSDTIDLGADVGARVITVHPPLANPGGIDDMTGGRWAAEEEALLRDATDDQDEAEAWFVDMLGPIAERAEAAGIVLALENMRAREGRARLNHAREIARFVRAIDLPAARICLDVRKARREGLDPAEFIRACGRWIANVHVAGFTTIGKPAEVGEGDIDWSSVVAALQAANYAGPLIYEGPPSTAGASLLALRDAARARDTGHTV
ncbi:MAG TPA: sugar phosphate isomerase/epimerase family protein [Armatimonadota bacterium]|nr:sugar phosphate isomerase/epimerase family protein [Armatimonadota bacterium]